MQGGQGISQVNYTAPTGGGTGSGTVTKQTGTITGDGATTVFPVVHTFGNNEVTDVVRDSNGVRQYPLADYSSTTQISYRFAVPPAVGEAFTVVMMGTGAGGGGGIPDGAALDTNGTAELDIDGSYVLDVI